MAYQNVGTPRFYISYGDWWKSMGIDVRKYNLLNPTLDTKLTITSTGSPWGWILSDYYLGSNNHTFSPSFKGIEDCNWFASLNHNVDPRFRFILKQYVSWADGIAKHDDMPWTSTFDTAVNYPIEYQGFSLIVKDNMWDDWSNFNTDSTITSFWIKYGLTTIGAINGQTPYFTEEEITFNVGCGVFGKTYDMPHSPDLNLTMEREYGGIKTIETKGGASLSNSFYNKPPAWGSLGAWELNNNAINHTGRRVWNLSFSYLSDEDIMQDNPTYNDTNSEWEIGDTTPDFMSEVVRKTNGGQLPFIFQPDGSNNNPDQFAICKFDQNSFQFKQVANGVYNVKLKIREVW